MKIKVKCQQCQGDGWYIGTGCRSYYDSDGESQQEPVPEQIQCEACLGQGVVEVESWRPFYFDGNNWFGIVWNEKDFKDLLAEYSKVNYRLEDILSCKECERTDTKCDYRLPKFGFRCECNGKKTLGEFLKENGMLVLDNPKTT